MSTSRAPANRGNTTRNSENQGDFTPHSRSSKPPMRSNTGAGRVELEKIKDKLEATEAELKATVKELKAAQAKIHTLEVTAASNDYNLQVEKMKIDDREKRSDRRNQVLREVVGDRRQQREKETANMTESELSEYKRKRAEKKQERTDQVLKVSGAVAKEAARAAANHRAQKKRR